MSELDEELEKIFGGDFQNTSHFCDEQRWHSFIINNAKNNLSEEEFKKALSKIKRNGGAGLSEDELDKYAKEFSFGKKLIQSSHKGE